jgi:hypothetical protein
MRLFPICFILFFISGCKKAGLDPIQIDDHIKSFYSFKKGSYWIMKDSISGQVDSFLVTDYQNSSINKGGGFSYQRINIMIHEYSRSSVDTFDWALIMENTSDNYLFLINRNKNIAFTTSNIIPTPNTIPLITYSQDGNSYNDVLVTPLANESPTEKIEVAINSENSFIRLAVNSSIYSHVWHLVYSRINR